MTDITIVNPTVARPVDDGDEIPKVGRWYWYKNPEPNTDEDGESSDPVLFCCVHVGSNYVGLRSPGGTEVRVHHDQFWDFCTLEYVAGNLTVQEPALPPPKKPRGPIDMHAKWRRDELKARKAMVGKVVQLLCPLTTQKGKSFKAGTLWYVEENERGGLVIALLDSGLKLQQDLQKEYRPYIRVSGLSHTDLKERVDLLDQFKQANKRERE